MPEWTVEGAYEKAKLYIDEMEIPFIKIDTAQREDITFVNLAEQNSHQLEEYLSASGAWLAYIELNLANLGAKKGAFETAFEVGLKKAKSIKAEAYREQGGKKPTIDEIEGEILVQNTELSDLLKTIIEIRAAYTKLEGRKNAYRGLFNTASRIVSVRSLEAGKTL